MRKVYAQPGQSLQQIGGTCPPNWIEMESERPSPLHIAKEDGTWYVNIEMYQLQKLQEINDACEAELGKLRETYPMSEILSWDRQEQEARSWLLDNNTPTPLIDNLAKARGIDRIELINRIIYKSDMYLIAVGNAVGKRQGLEDRIFEAKTVAELEKIKW